MNNEKKLQDMISEIYPDSEEIIPIGNHHLKRHYVYSIKKLNREYVVKIYFRKERFPNEVSALKLLENHEMKIPKLLNFGIYKGNEWIAYEKIKGETLTERRSKLPYSDLKRIYTVLGEEIGKVHSSKFYNQYGCFDETGNLGPGFDTLKDYMSYMNGILIKSLERDEHDEKELIKQALNYISNEILQLKSEHGVLCHNDINDRNIIVDKGEYKALIDFEQSSIHDQYREISKIEYYLKDFFPFFLAGYKRYMNFDEEIYLSRRKLYLLFYGLQIVSWSKKVDLNYYNEGLNILKLPIMRDCYK